MSEELEKRIGILERKLARQVAARKEAEEQLEKFATQIFYSNKALNESVLEAQKRQSELEFLATSTSNISSEASVTELVATTLELTGQFCNATFGACIFTERGELSQNPKPMVWQHGSKLADSDPLPLLLLKYIPIDTEELIDQWALVEVNSKHFSDIKWAVSVNFLFSDDQLGWLVFFLTSDLLDEEALYVLDTAKNHLRDGIEKRIHSTTSSISQSVLEQTAEHLSTAKKQLVQAERMSTLGQLAAGVAHEINNPIGFIKSNLGILQQNLNEIAQFIAAVEDRISAESINKKQFSDLVEQYDIDYLKQDCQEIIEDNQAGVVRISEIVASLKNFSHMGETDMSEVDINACIHTALKIAKNSIDSQHQLKIELDDELPFIHGNQGELQQVFINLMVNAGQAMVSPGVLTISSLMQDKQVLIAVSDTGMGMNEQTKNKLFTPFFTTKPVGEGTGLGLSVSRSIVEAHRGDILVDSEIGKGTTMTVVLPLNF